MKNCSKCDETKPIVDFIKNRNYCNACETKRRRERLELNPDLKLKVMEQKKEYRQKQKLHKIKDMESKQTEIGEGNKLCKKCNIVFPKINCGD